MWAMMLVMAFPVLGIALFFALPWPGALLLYAAGLALSLVFHRAMMTSMTRPVATGWRGMVGGTADVVAWASGHGTVRYQGELWRAREGDDAPLAPGAPVRIVRVDGLELIVEPASDPPPGGGSERTRVPTGPPGAQPV